MNRIKNLLSALVKIVFLSIVLMVLGVVGWKVGKWLFGIPKARPQTVQEYVQPDVAREMKKKFSQLSGMDIAPPEFADVAAVQKQTRHLRDSIAARNDCDQTSATQGQWSKARLVSSQSPIINPATDLATTTTRRWQCLLADGQWQDLASRDACSSQPLHCWRLDEPLYVDYSRTIQEPNSAVILLPAAQRSDDGLQYLQYWVYLNDVVSKDRLSVAPWARGMLRTNLQVNGHPKVIDRYVVTLQRGQSISDTLRYQPMPLEPWEKTEGWQRGWRLRCDRGTLSFNLNGQNFVFSDNCDTDTTEVENQNGTVTIKDVILANNSPIEEVQVEFVYFRHRGEGWD